MSSSHFHFLENLIIIIFHLKRDLFCCHPIYYFQQLQEPCKFSINGIFCKSKNNRHKAKGLSGPINFKSFLCMFIITSEILQVKTYVITSLATKFLKSVSRLRSNACSIVLSACWAQWRASARQTCPSWCASFRVVGGATDSPSTPLLPPTKFGIDSVEADEHPERILREEERPLREVLSSKPRIILKGYNFLRTNNEWC